MVEQTLYPPIKSMRYLISLSFFGVFLAVLVIGLGAYTRLTDAGLGCPDWPGCYGVLFEPAVSTLEATPWSTKAWTEMAHRYLAGSLGLLVLTLLGSVLFLRRSYLLPWKIPSLLLLLIFCQALLGMWTVTLKLHPTVVMSHLLGGFSTMTLFWLYGLQLMAIRDPLFSLSPAMQHRYKPFVLTALALLILQIALGAWTSANYAALVCPTFPQCHTSWLPASNFTEAFQLFHPTGSNFEFGLLDNAARMTIHMMHRLGALLATSAIFVTCGLIIKDSCSRHLSGVVGVIILLLCLQIALGITNVLAVLPLPIAVMHNVIAALLLLGMVTLTYSVCATRKEGRTS